MTAIGNNPQTINSQSPLNFRFNLKRAPSLNYFCQSVSLPEVTLPPARAPTPSINIPFWGDHIVYSPLSVSFKVDSDLQNWLEIFNWMKALANKDGDGKTYSQLQNNDRFLGYGLTSELFMSQNDSQGNPKLVWTFKNAWPTALKKLDFESTDDTVNYLTASATFYFEDFGISPA